jgi:hypothetical protein
MIFVPEFLVRQISLEFSEEGLVKEDLASLDFAPCAFGRMSDAVVDPSDGDTVAFLIVKYRLKWRDDLYGYRQVSDNVSQSMLDESYTHANTSDVEQENGGVGRLTHIGSTERIIL